MVINSDVDILFSTIEDRRTTTNTLFKIYSRYPLLEDLEENWKNIEQKIDNLLAESRYWLKGKKIRLYDYYYEVDEEKRTFINTIEKIKSIVFAIIFTFPGIFLKCLFWIFINPHIKQRNLQIFNISYNFQYFPFKNVQLKKLKSLNINHNQDNQKDSFLSQQPNHIINNIIGMLGNKEKIHLASACKKLYSQCLYYKPDINELFPKVIVRAVGQQFLENLPQGVLASEFHSIFFDAINYCDTLDNDSKIFVKGPKIVIRAQSSLWNHHLLIDRIIDSMGNQPIQYLATYEGIGLMIKVQNNQVANPKEKKDQLIIFLKLKNKWSALCFRTSGAMWTLLNNLRFCDDDPILEDYLKRLFEGKACGSFPDNLNENYTIDLKTQKASSILAEGPVFCTDGVTPVIQLWKPSPNQAQQPNN